MEDLWSEDLTGECMEFFRGKDFRICAELANMNLIDQVKLLNFVKGVIDSRKNARLRESSPVQKSQKGRPDGAFSVQSHRFSAHGNV
jgi:hypothetical protein